MAAGDKAGDKAGGSATSSALVSVARGWQGTRRTSVRAGIGRDVAEEDDALGIETVDEGGEALALDVADGQHESLDPRRGDGEEGILRHAGGAVIPSNATRIDLGGAAGGQRGPGHLRRGSERGEGRGQGPCRARARLTLSGQLEEGGRAGRSVEAGSQREREAERQTDGSASTGAPLARCAFQPGCLRGKWAVRRVAAVRVRVRVRDEEEEWRREHGRGDGAAMWALRDAIRWDGMGDGSMDLLELAEFWTWPSPGGAAHAGPSLPRLGRGRSYGHCVGLAGCDTPPARAV